MKRVWTADELVEYWTLTPDELALLTNKTGVSANKFRVNSPLVGAPRVAASSAPNRR